MAARPHTVQRLHYGRRLRALDRAAALAERLHLPPTDIEIDSLLRAARAETGLRGWGEAHFVERLRRLVEEARDPRYRPLARAIIRLAFVKSLANRLRVQEYARRHPDVMDLPIEKPIFILGFPRTGTTLLQHLLALDPGHRALRFWELTCPAPLDDDPAVDLRRRRRAAALTVALSDLVAPEQQAIHHVTPDTYEECWPLFYNSFAAMNFDLGSGLASFGDWLARQDMTGPYREYRLQLQVLAHTQPTGRFVLKCPEHLWFLDALLAVFPDARIVWTHRDPPSSVASYCSLISLNHRMLLGRIDPAAIGAHITDRFHAAVTRAMAVRERAPQSTFFDVDFVRLQADPTAMTARIRHWLGIAPDERTARAERDWLANERPDRRGSHRYSAGQWGLDPAAVRHRFADYVERFQIPVDAARKG